MWYGNCCAQAVINGLLPTQLQFAYPWGQGKPLTSPPLCCFRFQTVVMSEKKVRCVSESGRQGRVPQACYSAAAGLSDINILARPLAWTGFRHRHLEGWLRCKINDLKISRSVTCISLEWLVTFTHQVTGIFILFKSHFFSQASPYVFIHLQLHDLCT